MLFKISICLKAAVSPKWIQLQSQGRKKKFLPTIQAVASSDTGDTMFTVVQWNRSCRMNYSCVMFNLCPGRGGSTYLPASLLPPSLGALHKVLSKFDFGNIEPLGRFTSVSGWSIKLFWRDFLQNVYFALRCRSCLYSLHTGKTLRQKPERKLWNLIFSLCEKTFVWLSNLTSPPENWHFYKWSVTVFF